MIKFSFVGDISLGEHYFSFGHGPKKHAEKNYLFKDVEQELNKADYVIANLEGPISDKGMDKNDPEKMVFRASPKIIEQLLKANINILNIANNHILQHGEDVFFDTIKLLEENNIGIIGKNKQPALIVGGNSGEIAIFGCSDIEDNIYKHQNLYQKVDNEFYDLLSDAVVQHSQVMVIIHWGREDRHQPTERQIEIENKLKSIGVRVVVGHHPHIFYPIKYMPDFFCAYSLGNFIFDLTWDNKLIKTGVLNLQFNPSLEILSAEVVPVTIYNNGCTPKITGNPIEIQNGYFDLYKFKSAVRHLQLKKFLYFFTSLFKGNKSLKTTFMINKMKSKLNF